MKAKRLSAGILATMMALCTMGATGCGSSSDSKTAENGEATVLTVYTNRTDRVDDGTLENLSKSFEEANNCDVQYVGFKDYSTDIQTKMSSGDYGDVLMIPDEVQVDELKDYFEPLGTYDDMKDTYSWITKKMSSDKTVYGIPYGGTATGILYNTKVWSDAGITETPTTPEAFIEDLKKIKDKFGDDVVPYYTEYKDAWTIAQWDNLVISASGDPAYKTRLLQNDEALFDKDGGYYKVYKLMFDLYSQSDVLEKDHATTDWEKSKQYFADGNIGTIVLGSWAISQFQAFAENTADIGYMPVPITADDGKQYAQTSADYCVGVAKNTDNVELAKKFTEWFVTDSGFAASEGMIPTKKGAELPANLSAFTNCVLFEETVAPDELLGKFDEVDKSSNVGTSLDTSDNFKFKIAEAAFSGASEADFDAIISEQNTNWADAKKSVLG